MLQITIPATEQWDEYREEFITTKEQTLKLEHSLISVAKWESKWNKSFLSSKDKSAEEIIDYVRCMTLTPNVQSEIYSCLTTEQITEIFDYINAPMTATVLPKDLNRRSSREPITAELIYYWMISLNIPPEYEKWHLNRLITLIGVCNIKNQPPKKMNKRALMSRNSALNAARRKKFNSKG